MTSSNNIGVAILAAGSSSRLGRPKQLVDHNHTTLLQHTIDCCNSINFGSKTLILGASSDNILPLTDLNGFKPCINESWFKGLSESMHLAICEATANPQIQHLLFLLSDQPFVTASLLEQLIEAHEEITACAYNGQLGVPAIFSQGYFEELMSVNGDKGAKPVLRKYESIVKIIPFEKGSIDIDTEEDVERLNALKQSVE